MMAILVILLGVALEIVKANGWFIVPDIAIYIVFGVGTSLVLITIGSWINAKKTIKKVSRYDRF